MADVKEGVTRVVLTNEDLMRIMAERTGRDRAVQRLGMIFLTAVNSAIETERDVSLSRHDEATIAKTLIEGVGGDYAGHDWELDAAGSALVRKG